LKLKSYELRVIFTNTILTSSSIDLGEIPATWGESFGDFHFMDNGANELNSLNTTVESRKFDFWIDSSRSYCSSEILGQSENSCHAVMFLFFYLTNANGENRKWEKREKNCAYFSINRTAINKVIHKTFLKYNYCNN